MGGKLNTQFINDGLWQEICKRFSMFAPNRAGDPHVLSEIASQAAYGTFSALEALLRKLTTVSSFHPQMLPKLDEEQYKFSAVLAERFNYYGSDKTTVHSYESLYARLLTKICNDKGALLEIGLGTNNIDTPSNMGLTGQPGASVRAFRDALPQFNIYGADVDRRILFWEQRIRTFYVDQSDIKTFYNMQVQISEPLDIIIDDGLHAPHTNLNTLLFALDALKPGGHLVVEDIALGMLPVWQVVAQLLVAIGHEMSIYQFQNVFVVVVRKMTHKNNYYEDAVDLTDPINNPYIENHTDIKSSQMIPTSILKKEENKKLNNKILIVTPDIYGPIRNGGIGTAFYNLALAIKKAGAKTSILYALGEHTESGSIDQWRKFYNEFGIDFISLPGVKYNQNLDAVPFFRRLSWRIHQWLTDNQVGFDLVIFPEWMGLAYYSLLAKTQGLEYSNLSIIINTHSPELWAVEGNRSLPASIDYVERDFMERYSVYLAEFVVSPSSYMLEWMRKNKWNISENLCTVIPNIMPESKQYSSSCILPHNINKTVFLGRLEIRKGLKLFCDSIDRLLPKLRSQLGTICFYGKVSDIRSGDSITYIKDRSKNWGLHIEILSNLNREQVFYELHQLGTLAVIPSLLENSPYTVLECLREGICFLASSVGGIPEMVSVECHSTNLFAPNPIDLSTKLLDVINNGLESAKCSWSDNEVTNKWISFLSSIDKKKNSPITSKPLVTICLVHFNRPRLLSQAIDSLIGQTYSNIEIILVDDGSTDIQAVNYLDSLSYDFGQRGWKIIRQKNSYLGAARNNAASHARGEYILFMDDDNIAAPEMVEIFVKAAQYSNSDILTSVAMHFHGDGLPGNSLNLAIPLGGALGAGLFQNVFGDAHSFWRKEAFYEIGGFSTDYGLGHEDWEIFAEAVLSGLRLMVVPVPLYWYRVNQHGMSGTTVWSDIYSNLARSVRPYLRHDPHGMGVALAYSLSMFWQHIVGTSTNNLEYKATIERPSLPPQHHSLPWLVEERFSPHEKDWAQVEIFQRKLNALELPRIAIALVASEKRSAQLTLESIVERQLVEPALSPFVMPDEAGGLISAVNKLFLANKAEWFCFVDAGDQLAPDAIFRIQMAIQNHPEWQLIYTDEDSLTADGQHVNPHCKPDFNIDYLRSLPYIGGLLIIKKELFEALGGFDPQADGAEDYDFVLRAWEKIGDAGIGHIPEVLYHRLQGGGHCNKSVEEILQVSQAALQRHLQRLNIAAEVLPGPFPPATRVRYPLTGTPLVSIIIPTRNQLGYLQRCVESLIEKTRYAHYEMLIVDNDSDDAEARTYLDMLAAQEEQLGGRLRVLRHPGPFNFSAMNNRAVEQARGDYVLLLNNDTAALHDDWLDEMVSQILRPEVGIVGAKLLFPDGKIQHAGVILGMRGPAEHPFIAQPPEYRGYFGRAMLTQNLSAVTGACLLIGKSLYQELGGLDEKQFQVSYNDIDLCLKAREAGHKIVFTPWAMLLHEGSASQRGEVEKKPSPEKEKRFAGEKMAFYQKWLPQLAFDPAYNRHLSLASTDFLLEDQAALTWDPEWRPRPRILVHPADREGCGEYRIISPMRALQKAGRAQGWETMRIFEPAEMERFSPESIVLQRQMEWPQIEALERHKKLLKTFRVFEIDDLITNLPVKSLHKAQIHKDIAKRFRKAAGLCNRLVVATEPLAKAYKGFADELRVQPNCIEEAIWGALQPRRRAEAKPRVGWAGGVGHTGDLEMIADVVRDLADEVDWVFFGLCPDALRPYVREFHTGVPLPQYPSKLASLDLDLALAPLENNSFNEAKSHLRILEYGILGYPVICSDIFPYQGNFPVTRVANRYRDWVRAIREQIADRQALATAGDHLREYVRAHWLLEEHLDDWLAAWLP